MVAKTTPRPSMSAVPLEPGRVPRTPLKRRAGGLSRFYKAKAQSFARLSDSLNTEWGESARGLAKRLKLSHPAGECVEDVCAAAAHNRGCEAEQQRGMQWLQKCTEEACAMLEGLSMGCAVGPTGGQGNVCAMRIVTDLGGMGGPGGQTCLAVQGVDAAQGISANWTVERVPWSFRGQRTA